LKYGRKDYSAKQTAFDKSKSTSFRHEAFGNLWRIYDAYTRAGNFDQILFGFQTII